MLPLLGPFPMLRGIKQAWPCLINSCEPGVKPQQFSPGTILYQMTYYGHESGIVSPTGTLPLWFAWLEHSDQKQLLLHTGAGDLGTVGRAATPAESPASPVWHLLGTSVHSRALQRREGKMKWELLLINLGLPSWSSWRQGKRHLTLHLLLYANKSHCNYPWQGSKHSPATFTVCFLCITFLALFSTWRSQDTERLSNFLIITKWAVASLRQSSWP